MPFTMNNVYRMAWRGLPLEPAMGGAGPVFFTKKFFRQQGKDTMVAEMYLGTLSTPFYL